MEQRWFETELGQQKALVIYPADSVKEDNLIVFLHGDSPFRDPVYQYYIARNIAKMTNSVTVALLRPGYKDDCGDQSEGIRGLTMGDNYTEEVVSAIASVIASMKLEVQPKKTIVMGHSGGAALTALLVQSFPTLTQQSLLVACPCNLDAWRKSMEGLTENPEWSQPMPGLSPLDRVDKLNPSQKFHLFVGEKDVVAPPFLSEEFYDKAVRHVADIQWKKIEEADHESILRPDVLKKMLAEAGLITNQE